MAVSAPLADRPLPGYPRGVPPRQRTPRAKQAGPPTEGVSNQREAESGKSQQIGDIMDVEGVAVYLGFSVDTIYKKVQAREIPFTRIGNLLRFTRWSIDAWLDRNTVTPVESLYDQVAKLLNRYHLQQWLEGRGVDWKSLTEEQLVELARSALEDLRQNEGTS